ncbi:hypothetical protein NEFER03_0687 [Nematocida sp. LUAm3]|nr:hypothetical protein NEFER03_0687 [Nematocida sp. LUAm3]KAI5175146.1 hypothetical protein NEFER02_1107 [Nematocida sp. LUAm2]KAI5178182.1 hypothetical protein NEFER01_1360 [Nematocida sp. LUAm1]
MSQWSRRRNRGMLPRTLSLPIFFENISEEDQGTAIRNALQLFKESNYSSIKTVNLSFLQIKELPIALIIESLKKEKLLENQIDHERIIVQESMFIMNFEGNLIESLPNELFGISGIQGILLRSNRISYIPPCIGELKGLSTLTLANNPIKYLPYEILSLPLTNYTVTPRDFLSSEEVLAHNGSVVFEEMESLSDLCLKRTCKALGSINSRFRYKNYSKCSLCKSYSTRAHSVIKCLVFQNINTPIAHTVCSKACMDALLQN